MFLYSLALTALFIFVFALLYVNINRSWLLTTDNKVSNFIINNFRSKYLDATFYNLDKIYFVIISLLYFLFSIYYYRTHPGNKLTVVKELLIWPCIFITTPMFVVIILASSLKQLIKRKRPYIKAIKTYSAHSYSFPSIHAASSITVITGLFFLITFSLSLYGYYPAQTSILMLIAALICCHVSICYSRIYLGVHYLSDVVGGTFFSLSLLGILLTAFVGYYRI